MFREFFELYAGTNSSHTYLLCYLIIFPIFAFKYDKTLKDIFSFITNAHIEYQRMGKMHSGVSFLCFHLFSVKYFKNVCINFIVLCIDLLIVPQFAVQKAEVLNSDKKGKQVNEYKQQRL